MDPEEVVVEFDRQRFKLTLGKQSYGTQVLAIDPLFDEVDPSRCKLVLKDSCVLLRLRRATPRVQWPALAGGSQPVTAQAAPPENAPPPASPSNPANSAEEETEQEAARAVVTQRLQAEEAALAASRPELEPEVEAAGAVLHKMLQHKASGDMFESALSTIPNHLVGKWRGEYNWSLLHLAADLGRADVLSLLANLDNAPVDAAAMRGATPLHCAVGANSVKCVDVLLQAGATVDQVDDAGLSALLSACMIGGAPGGGHKPGSGAAVVVRLLQADSDPLLTDNQGRNSLDVAKEYDSKWKTGWWKEAFKVAVEKMMREVPTRDFVP
eukprot:TRINITY_DN9554_c0_g1_i6.p1 TRINITY_DN9554_c0_g1~~TRINITY_DN9554_c0_g1_i6.p1  ORF type:complete len:326 (-),score=88.64 TRINITY_DN9554_c0_g1_i6:43-1020(-)